MRAVPVGSISEHLNKYTQKKELYIKLGKGKWQRLQIYNWEQMHGSIARNYTLKVIDEGKDMYDPSNMRLISLAKITAESLAEKKKRTGSVRNKPTVKQAKKVKVSPPDLTGRIPVFIPEMKMTVYAKPGTTIAALREKYLGHREFVRKAYAS